MNVPNAAGMIAVIADDLSGAAELANAALQAGYSAEVQSRFFAESNAGVICVNTETRSLPPEEAARHVEEVARSIAVCHPALVYKKCDSVLRGPVAAESLAIARALGKKRVRLISANPNRRRIIRGGEYFVDGIPLARTVFADDPEFPRQSSKVTELLGNAPGIDTPDVVSPGDLARQAATVDADTLPAGALEFFSALLKTLPAPGKTSSADQKWEAENGSSLFVCGSKAAWQMNWDVQCARRRIPVFLMPHPFFCRDFVEEMLAGLAVQAAAALQENGKALLAIGNVEPKEVTSEMLVHRLAQAAESTIKRSNVSRVFLEGGSTAAALVRKLGISRFNVEASPGVGVGALRAIGRDGPLFLVKPGSYPWPESVWPNRVVARFES